MKGSKLTGAWGEALAAEYLRKKRYTLVAAGYYCKFGEIDLIVQNRKFLVFVEVKLRKTDNFAMAREYVNAAKQNRIRTTAAIYLSENPTQLQPRFDVIEVITDAVYATKAVEINHIIGAYEAGDLCGAF